MPDQGQAEKSGSFGNLQSDPNMTQWKSIRIHDSEICFLSQLHSFTFEALVRRARGTSSESQTSYNHGIQFQIQIKVGWGWIKTFLWMQSEDQTVFLGIPGSLTSLLRL